MASITCGKCKTGYEFSNEVDPITGKKNNMVCPVCGHNPNGAMTKQYGNQSVIALVLVILGGYLFYNQYDNIFGASSPIVTHQMQNITNQVLQDQIKQYNIAKSNGGSDIDICVQAGLVVASALQAQDNVAYAQWKSIEKSDCSKAGIEK